MTAADPGSLKGTRSAPNSTTAGHNVIENQDADAFLQYVWD
jgi:hypothetical protein